MSKTRYRLKFLAERFGGFNVSDFTYGMVQEFIDERYVTGSSGGVLRDVATIKAIINKARQKAGLEGVRFHDLRHTFASRLVQGGVPLYDVMHMTGHKSLSMVQRYAHLAPEFQEAAICVLDQRPVPFGRNSGTKNRQDSQDFSVKC